MLSKPCGGTLLFSILNKYIAVAALCVYVRVCSYCTPLNNPYIPSKGMYIKKIDGLRYNMCISFFFT